MKRLFIFTFLAFALMSFSFHKFYVSVTDIEHDEEQKSLQIISRIFADDLENTLSARYDTKVQLTKKIESENADQLIEKYLKNKLTFIIKGEKQTVNYLGKKYRRDQVVLFLEVEDIPDFKEIEIENLILTDMFDGQKNLVHLKHAGETKSAVLMKDNPNTLLKFKN
ncbi:MAG: DUF6702 family protein [Bacteroidota bacterium]